jgi:hypothetical protein
MEYIIILLLTIVIVLLVIVILFILKKTKLLSKSEIELISFIITIYVDYGHSLDLYDEKKHELIKQKLIDLKKKYFNVNL